MEKNQPIKDPETRKQLASEFGQRYGWKLTNKPFSISTLAQRKTQQHDERNAMGCTELDNPRAFFDHAYYYRKGRKAAAIVAHLYHVPEQLHEVANAINLKVEIITDFDSWWFPGETTPVLYTPFSQNT